jgi:hypothetical protein
MPGGNRLARTVVVRVSTDPARTQYIACANFQQATFELIRHDEPP